MKKNFLLLVPILSLTLTSCDLFLRSYKNHTEQVDVYEIDKLKESENNNLDQCLTESMNLRFIDGEQYIPYLSIKDYSSLYRSHYAQNARSEVTKQRGFIIWTIYLDDEPVFMSAISTFLKEIIVAGNISSGFKANDDPRDLKALNYALKTNTTSAHLSNVNYATYSYSDCVVKCIKEGGDYYFPLGLLDLAYSESSDISFFYNYKHIYATRDVDNFSEATFVENNNTYTVESQMEQAVTEENMPDYLVDYNANLFIFLMDNLYGLKSNKRISSMKRYYANYGIYKDLFSDSASTRSKAYCNALGVLDDNHTTLVSVTKTWGETNLHIGGKGVVARSSLRSKLSQMRTDYYRDSFGIEQESEGGQLIYSDTGKTAMFHFETFVFGTTEQVFDADEQIKNDAYKYDTYINFIRLFNTIKQRGNVENVIIDISTNRGGVVGVMMKLLALVSKNNDGVIGMCDGPTSVVNVIHSSVDVNGDKQYEEDEIFGDDFNIYLLTSDCSFSCGNAFPCFAKQLGVKIIGDKSGGGECAVAIHYLPNSQYVYHSSNLHLGIYDDAKKEFMGLENGAEVDIPLNNNKPMSYVDEQNQVVFDIPTNFYQINVLENLINQQQIANN